jgi:SAM-dependent methyltransferase
VFLKRDQVPVHQNLLFDDPRSAVGVRRGDLRLAVCRECGFVFNQAHDPSLLSYGDKYENAQENSTAFASYLSRLSKHLIYERSLRDCRVVEVGCGNGSFLRKLVEEGGNIGYGFDPSYTGPATDLGGRLHFEARYYGPDTPGIHADWVVCRHVIEHVADPVGLLVAIRRSLGRSSRARIFVETPTVEWILRNRVLWDFFYEHCSYFSQASLKTAIEIAGFTVESSAANFDAQYIWMDAVVGSPRGGIAVTKKPGDLPALAARFASSEEELLVAWRGRVMELAQHGGVAIWGAGAKGTTLANLVDPDRRWISCIVDLNPGKQGHYLPGTGHPIISYEELPKYGVGTAILMNPVYRDENLGLLRKAGSRVDLLDLSPVGKGAA